MAASVQVKPGPVVQVFETGRPYLLPSNYRYDNVPTHMSSPMAVPWERPIALVPNIELDRMIETDNSILATLKPFRRRGEDSYLPQGYQPARVPNVKTPLPSPMPSIFLGGQTRTKLVSPAALATTRRSPARSSRSGGSIPEEKGEKVAFVAPVHLHRPIHPLKLSSGDEVWWPLNGVGDISVHVFICTVRPTTTEKLVRCFDLAQLQSQSLSPTLQTLASQQRDRSIARVSPGYVLPVPGELTVSERARYRRRSTPSLLGPATLCSPVPKRQSSFADYPAEKITHETAAMHLPILHEILIQDKRILKPNDKIVIPMPYPRAWPETVRYLYMKDPEVLSEAVKCNIVNLGGRF